MGAGQSSYWCSPFLLNHVYFINTCGRVFILMVQLIPIASKGHLTMGLMVCDGNFYFIYLFIRYMDFHHEFVWV